MTDILAAIDAAVGCQQCGGPLGPSPSDDFCRQDCQDAWHAAHTDRLAGYREPWDRPWDFPGIGYDAHSTNDHAAVTLYGPRGYQADLVITDEVHTFDQLAALGGWRSASNPHEAHHHWTMHRPEFRLPRSTSDLAADYRAARRALLAATTLAQREAVELRFESLGERSREVWAPIETAFGRIFYQIGVAAAAAARNLARLFDDLGTHRTEAGSYARVTVTNSGDRPAAEPDLRAAALAARRDRNTGPPRRGRPPRSIGRPSTTRPH